MIILQVTTTGDLITGMGQQYRAAHARAVKGTVEDYHEQLFPKHFFNSNRSRYRLAPRSQFYLKVIKPKRGVGTGRFVDLILKGVTRRRMMAFFTVRATDGGNTWVLRMQAPGYFANRFRNQPDMAAEVQQHSQDDLTKMGGFYRRRMTAEWEKAKQKRTRKG